MFLVFLFLLFPLVGCQDDFSDEEYRYVHYVDPDPSGNYWDHPLQVKNALNEEATVLGVYHHSPRNDPLDPGARFQSFVVKPGETVAIPPEEDLYLVGALVQRPLGLIKLTEHSGRSTYTINYRHKKETGVVGTNGIQEVPKFHKAQRLGLSSTSGFTKKQLLELLHYAGPTTTRKQRKERRPTTDLPVTDAGMIHVPIFVWLLCGLLY